MGKITQKLGLKGTRHFHAHEIARFDALSGLPLASFRQRAWAISIDVMIAGTLKVLLHLSEVHDHSDGPVTVASLLMEAVHWLKEVVESVLYFGVLLKLGRGQTPGRAEGGVRSAAAQHGPWRPGGRRHFEIHRLLSGSIHPTRMA